MEAWGEVLDTALAEADLAIGLVGEDGAEENDWAAELVELLAERTPALNVRRIKADPLTQDLGAVLAIVLGSSSVTVLAGGLAAWLRRRNTVSMVLKKRDRHGATVDVTVRGRPDERIEKIVTEFLKK
ncbi:effector-associated constant component EACC1 [Streptomyces sp. NBC_01244]|uniref:effector-associated constant component EACC1 n=1 Tax=Streptomyces sp. NBC_01244 TaxID=2903797 RepID=UPI002E0E8678|nr:hypothetical protein OG247_14360 [Streptomyces sp. NBC_01244]